MSSKPTSAKLKDDIDRGRGGDKVNVGDPAAAPLGTDEEAAGTPASAGEIKRAHDSEIGSAPVTSERKDGDHAVALYVLLIIALGIAVTLAIYLP